MERLTYFENGKWYIRIGDTEFSGKWVNKLADKENRLMQYERIGTPSEINRVMDAYGRGMTLRTEVGKRLSLMREIPTKRLHEIADAEKDGRCIVIPCKVGDKMQYMDDESSMGVEIVEKIVVEIETDSGIYSVDELGPEDFKSPQLPDHKGKESVECADQIKELSPRAQKLYSDLVTGKALYWEGEQDGKHT